jgi:pyruvate dehydrogenase E2 component (dihydrolipoamide acetyltransferase)
MGDFTMPSLGADMESGKVTRWLVKPGDEVHRGDIVAEVETEKSNIEVEIFENGRIDELVVPEGERVPVGAVLARISSQGTAAPPSEPTASSPPAPRPREVGLHEGPSRPVKVSPEAKATVPASAAHPAPVESPLVRRLAERLGVDLASLPGSGHGGAMTRADVERAALASAKEVAHRGPGERRPSSSPFARRLAERLGVDLAAVSGSGPGGSVIERDVRQAALAARHEEVTPAPTTTEDRQRAMQRAIGALMARSKREIPHYYLSATIDLTAAAAWLEQANLERPVADRLVMAVHLGIAISQRSGGLIAPAIHDAQQLTLDELMTRVRDLVRRARAGVLRSSEMSSPTLTVTNLGDLGVDSVFGVIYPPQVALVGFGRVREHAWAEGGVLGVRPCIVATLSGDHRVSDGMRGAHFLTEIDRLLQEPGKL